MAGVYADRRQPLLDQRMVEPGRQRTCLEHDALRIRCAKADLLRQLERIGRALAPPHSLALAPHRDHRLAQRNIQSHIGVHRHPSSSCAATSRCAIGQHRRKQPAVQRRASPARRSALPPRLPHVLCRDPMLALLMPLAMLLMEPAGWRQMAVGGATVMGAAVCARGTYGIVAYPSRVHRPSFDCLPESADRQRLGRRRLRRRDLRRAALSTYRVVRWFGVLNVIGLTVVMTVRGYAFISVWCFYAAILSIMIYWDFPRRHIDIDKPNSSFGPEVASELGSLRWVVLGSLHLRSRLQFVAWIEKLM